MGTGASDGRLQRIRRIRSIRGPVILFVVSLVLVVGLLVLWNVALAYDYQRIRELTAGETGALHWALIGLGSAMIVTTIVLLSVLAAQLFTQIRFSQRLSTSIATFTHELNSPLASIKMFAQTLGREGLSPDERRRFVNLILVDVERLGRQISNVLQGAQLESLFGFSISRDRIELRQYLVDYVEQRRLFLERLERRADLELAPGAPVVVSIDRHAFRAALDNLTDNAVKYAKPEGVTVTLATSLGPRGDHVRIDVVDDGRGIPPQDLERVFDRFGRLEVHDPGRRQPGTGLGLWIVEAIVEAHGGRIRATSEGLGRGTTIRIELPVVEAAGPLEPAGTVAAEGATAGGEEVAS